MSRIYLAGALALGVTLAGCGGGALDRARFVNQTPVTAVNDRLLGPKPETNREAMILYSFDQLFHRRLVRMSELRVNPRARNVNAMDEVPDSTWFTNRIGTRELTPEQIRRGPLTGRSPDKARPWKVTGTKVGGRSVGVTIEDSAGKKYILKFDKPGYPELETSAGVVVNRLMWALGYNVPEDEIVSLTRRDLALADDATVKDVFDHKRPMTEADIDRLLSQIDVGKGGKIRGVVSEYVPGEPIGGFEQEGVRDDDPNDVVPHQDRRDLRGLGAIFAWVKHSDVKESNTLDSWVETPGAKGHGYIVHYQIDFGIALGVRGWQNKTREDGYAHFLDVGDMAENLVTLGVTKHRWEDLDADDYHGVGLFETDDFDPTGYKPRIPWAPLDAMDRFDALWASRKIAALTPRQIAAAVDAAELSDPAVARSLVRALIIRQRKLAGYWFSLTNPLDRFEVAGTSLCFDDLLLSYKLTRAGTTYRATAHDRNGRKTGWRKVAAADSTGRVCLDGLRPGGARDGYTIVRIETVRDGYDYDPVLVHLALDRSRLLRPIGVRRL